jgi:two-component system OmpR family sensor kinase
VVTNLVANAVRHTPDGTPVEVAVGVEPASQAAAGDGNAAAAGDRPCAVLEVRDHGAGLPPDEAGKIFERFYRVDSSRRRGNGGGSGLGLSIVSAVTAAHGGTVDVRTTPGGGATFRVALPLATQPSASAPA